jgi:hypothetical protein
LNTKSDSSDDDRRTDMVTAVRFQFI